MAFGSKAIDLTRKNSDLLSRFEEIARNRYQVGKVIQQGVLKPVWMDARLRTQLRLFLPIEHQQGFREAIDRMLLRLASLRGRDASSR